jgi:cytoskeletal protein RodZ
MGKYIDELGPRSSRRARRRKTNRVLNILIGIVLLFILLIGGSLFWNNTDDERADSATKLTTKKTNEEQTKSNSDNRLTNDDQENAATKEDKTTDTVNNEPKDDVETMDDQDVIVTEGSDDPNVIQTVVKANWEPIGTNQTGEHVSSYDKDSLDWEEKLQAIAYALGVAVDEMTVWYVENGGSPHTAIGTITTSQSSDVYRVYIEWVDEKGWKPTKIELLKENDKANGQE